MIPRMENLQYELPEHILRKKYAGDFEGARRAVDAALRGETPNWLRERLEVERDMLEQLPRRYVHTRAEALAMCQRKIPSFTEAEFEALEDEGALDFLYVNGEKKYFRLFLQTLLKVNAEFARRAGEPIAPEKPMLDEVVRAVAERGEFGVRIRMRSTLTIEDEAFEAGESYLVHLPLPARAQQIERIDIRSASLARFLVGDEDQPQRTISWRAALEANAPFSVEYEFDARIRRPEAGRHVYPDLIAPCADDLAELAPHIRFTPTLRALHGELAGGERDPYRLARRFYDYITTKVNYSFVRQYFAIENGAEYAAVNRKGDCGLQALLFIALCRLSGVPARWQSGLSGSEDDMGCHDWAQFYTEAYGWLFADCSFGGSAYRAGAMDRWNFYFGSLDPYRVPANRAYFARLSPAKLYARTDPYDNQDGEVETESRALASREYDTKHEILSVERL